MSHLFSIEAFKYEAGKTTSQLEEVVSETTLTFPYNRRAPGKTGVKALGKHLNKDLKYVTTTESDKEGFVVMVLDGDDSLIVYFTNQGAA